MIEKAIADWLTKTNERHYLPAFCQVLIHQGHEILYVSRHSTMERGKDIATIGPDGTYHAYQTKTGDIDKTAWRKDLGEFQELIQHPIDHPNIDKKQPFRAYLVTNGTINEPVRHDITAMNEHNDRQGRGWARLETIDHHSLTQQFVDAHQHFLPKELHDTRDFLNLYLHDGRAMLPKERFTDTLTTIAFASTPKQPSHARHAITASVIITSYLLTSFEQAKNWYALLEGWWLLAASIIRYATKHHIPKADWLPSLDLIRQAIDRHATALQDDALRKEFWLEQPIHVDGGLLLCARTTIVLGTIAWHATRKPKCDDAVYRLLLQHEEHLWYWGEGAFPYFFHIIRCYEKHGDTARARALADWLLTHTVKTHTDRKGPGMPSVYVSVEETLRANLALATDELTRTGTSCVVRPLLDLLLRRGWDTAIRAEWVKYTYVSQEEFRPTCPEDGFAWRNEDGVVTSAFPQPTDSIERLRTEARARQQFDPFLAPFADLLGLHLIVSPFRITPTITGALDQHQQHGKHNQK